MIKVMVAGRGWFAAEVAALVSARADCVLVGGFGVGPNDRLASFGGAYSYGNRLTSENIPAGTDLIIGAAAHCYVEKSARLACGIGAVGYHPSLLPLHRGRDAVRWAIKMRDRITGGSLYWMDDGADTGPVAAQDWCFIRPDDDAGSLWRRELAPMGLALVSSLLGDLAHGRVPSEAQDEALATWEPGLSTDKFSGV